MASLDDRFWKKVDIRSGDECWEWRGAKAYWGYGKMWNGIKQELAHRLSWVINRGTIPDGIFVLHKCDNPPCVNPNHLFLGTHADNMRDKHKKGRDNGFGEKGERHSRSKLSKNQVIRIRAMYKKGNISQREIARKFNVSRRTIRDILDGTNWSHLL